MEKNKTQNAFRIVKSNASKLFIRGFYITLVIIIVFILFFDRISSLSNLPWTVILILLLVFNILKFATKPYDIIGKVIFHNEFMRISIKDQVEDIFYERIKQIEFKFMGYEGEYSFTRLLLTGAYHSGAENYLVVNYQNEVKQFGLFISNPDELASIHTMIRRIESAYIYVIREQDN